MATLRPETRLARRAGAALRKAGIPTGYQYNAFGYRTHDGLRITEPGVEITTKGRNSLSREDEPLDHVMIYPVAVATGGDPDVEDDVKIRALDALLRAGFEARIQRGAIRVDLAEAEVPLSREEERVVAFLRGLTKARRDHLIAAAREEQS